MNIKNNEPLFHHTTFRTGGSARFFVEVSNVGELAEIISHAHNEGLPYLVLGGGSNVLISDDGFDGYVIRPLFMGIGFEEQEDGVRGLVTNDKDAVAGTTITIAGAGEQWDDFVLQTVLGGLSGLENLSWIPGSVGAAPVQNIGAYGTELVDVIEWVEVFDPAVGAVKKLSREECGFRYRDSVFKSSEGRRFVITRIAVRLKRDGSVNISYKDLKEYFSKRINESSEPSTASEVRDAVIEIRKRKLPDVRKLGTVGSFFKNPIISEEQFAVLAAKFPGIPSFPVEIEKNSLEKNGPKTPFKKIPLAWILDKVCGLNGFREGNVGLYETQPLALVNFGGATSAEIKKFAEKISHTVKEKAGLDIEWEVNFIS